MWHSDNEEMKQQQCVIELVLLLNIRTNKLLTKFGKSLSGPKTNVPDQFL